MKGRFRKGKKAFRCKRHDRTASRYEAFLLRRVAQRKLALKTVQISVIHAVAIAQVNMIRATHEEPTVKALKIETLMIDTAQAQHKIMVSN